MSVSDFITKTQQELLLSSQSVLGDNVFVFTCLFSYQFVDIWGPGDERNCSTGACVLHSAEDIHDVGTKVAEGAPRASISSDNITTDLLEIVEIGGDSSRMQALHIKQVFHVRVLEALPLHHLGEDGIEGLRARVSRHIWQT